MSLRNAKFSTGGVTTAPEIRAVETVQDSIPIMTVHDKDNLIESYPGSFSRTYRLGDINYSTQSDEEQERIFERWRAFINSAGVSTELQLSIFNRNIDMDAFRDAVLKKERGDDLDYLREQLNNITMSRVLEGKNGIRSDTFLTISAHVDDEKKAVNVFQRLDQDTDSSLSKLGSSAKPISIEDRLTVLYDIYNPGHSGEFLSKTKVVDENGDSHEVSAFSFENMREMGLGVADLIAPSAIVYHSNYIELGDKYCRVLKVMNYPAILSDNFLTSMCAVPFNALATLNIKPISNAEADRIVNLNLTLIRNEKMKAQQRARKDGGSDDMISQTVLEREQETLNLRDDMREHDEHLFETTLTFVVFADDLAHLQNYSDSLISEARKSSVELQPMVGSQAEGFNSSLPLCYNQLKNRRTFKSSSVAALIPFSVTELSDNDGINYSVNAVTRNLIMYDRKSQFNSNGFILGVSGSGKSFAAKTEMLSVMLGTDDDLIVIDPESEYGPICSAVGGTMIRIAPGGQNILNPMDICVDKNVKQDGDPVLEKVDFMLNLTATIVKSAFGTDSVQETILDECIHKLYAPFYRTGMDGHEELMPIPKNQMPTLTDLYQLLLHRTEPEARDLIYALKLYTGDGSLSIFGGQTNVDLDNRFVVFDINALGKKLKPVAMLVILDAIWQRIVHNRSIGRHTWMYVDEIYLLFRDEISAEWLQQLWKRARKYGGVPTGITQNVEDLLTSETARSMLANSSFVQMLNQAPTDREHLKDLLHLSESQCDYITDAPRGQGLIYTGKQTIPFYSRFPKDNDLYKFLTSDLDEIKRFQEQEYQKKLQKEAALLGSD